MQKTAEKAASGPALPTANLADATANWLITQRVPLYLWGDFCASSIDWYFPLNSANYVPSREPGREAVLRWSVLCGYGQELMVSIADAFSGLIDTYPCQPAISGRDECQPMPQAQCNLFWTPPRRSSRSRIRSRKGGAVSGAGARGRTGTGLAAQQILSLVRLPVPPRPHTNQIKEFWPTPW
jgi:hypothetical protein